MSLDLWLIQFSAPLSNSHEYSEGKYTYLMSPLSETPLKTLFFFPPDHLIMLFFLPTAKNMCCSGLNTSPLKQN